MSPDSPHFQARSSVLAEVRTECESQDQRWGAIRDYPDGTDPIWRLLANDAKQAYNAAEINGVLTWLLILREEVYEAFAEKGRDRLRAELIQVAAVCINWIMALDRRKGCE